MTGSPRAHVQLALAQPQRYMNVNIFNHYNNNYNTNANKNKRRRHIMDGTDMPYACVIYAIYQECGYVYIYICLMFVL